MSQRFANGLRWLSRRTAISMALLLFSFVVILLWIGFAIFGEPSESVALALAAISAFFAAVSSFGALFQAIEVQRQRENLERPYIVVYFDVTPKGAIYVVIENFGSSPAKNVKVSFDPSFIDHKNQSLNDISLFANAISFMPPRKTIKQFVGGGPAILNRDNLRFTVSISYMSLGGESFYESDIIDLAYMKDMSRPMNTGEDHLEAIASSIKNMQQTLDRIQYIDALQVVTETRSERDERLFGIQSSDEGNQQEQDEG